MKTGTESYKQDFALRSMGKKYRQFCNTVLILRIRNDSGIDLGGLVFSQKYLMARYKDPSPHNSFSQHRHKESHLGKTMQKRHPVFLKFILHLRHLEDLTINYPTPTIEALSSCHPLASLRPSHSFPLPVGRRLPWPRVGVQRVSNSPGAPL